MPLAVPVCNVSMYVYRQQMDDFDTEENLFYSIITTSKNCVFVLG